MKKLVQLSAAVAVGVFAANMATMAASAVVVKASLPEPVEVTYSATTSLGTKIVTGLDHAGCMKYEAEVDGVTCTRD